MKSKSLSESMRHAIDGIWFTIWSQRNMKIHLVVGGLVVICSIFLHVSTQDFAILLIMISLVLVSELLNTSMEILLDMITEGYKKEVKHIKDIQAGAVLVFSVFSVIVGVLILLPYIYRFILRVR